MQIIDADGHINDHACGDDIAGYMPKGNQMAKLFPEFDHLHFRYLKQLAGHTTLGCMSTIWTKVRSSEVLR
jgi:hypothetical protein